MHRGGLGILQRRSKVVPANQDSNLYATDVNGTSATVLEKEPDTHSSDSANGIEINNTIDDNADVSKPRCRCICTSYEGETEDRSTTPVGKKKLSGGGSSAHPSRRYQSNSRTTLNLARYGKAVMARQHRRSAVVACAPLMGVIAGPKPKPVSPRRP